MEGLVYDTAIPAPYLDELTMGAGIYDELYVTLDNSKTEENVKPDYWDIRDIMNAEFSGSLEAGTLSESGNTVDKIQVYRRKYLSGEDWLLIGEFDYAKEFNIYTFIDRLAEQGAKYEYGLLPVSGTILGDLTLSPPIDVNFDGIYLSDTENNFHMEVNYDPSTVEHHTNKAEIQPLNGAFPVVVFGSENYRSGTLKFMPLSHEIIDGYNPKIDGIHERTYRQRIIDFINNRKPKVLRNEDGEVMVVVTSGLKSDAFGKGQLEHVKELTFDFTEIGKLDYDTMADGGLIGTAGRSNYTFDEDGNAVIIDRINAERRGVTD